MSVPHNSFSNFTPQIIIYYYLEYYSKLTQTVNWKERRQYDRFGHSMWKPKKRITRYQMDHLRELHRDFPGEWTLSKLSKHFNISHSAVKRILRSKFEPSEEIQNRQDSKVLESREIKRKDVSLNKKPKDKNNNDIRKYNTNY